MNTSSVFLPFLLGTNRKMRKSAHVAHWMQRVMTARPEIQTQLFDVASFTLPQDDSGTEIKALFPEWRDAIIRADGLVVVAPEYNHGYPGMLKAVLDYDSRVNGFLDELVWMSRTLKWGRMNLASKHHMPASAAQRA